MDKRAILEALLTGDDSSPALNDWYTLATERRAALRSEIASDYAQQLAQAASSLPMDWATPEQAEAIQKLRRTYGAEWLIREPGISLARNLRQRVGAA